MKKIYFKTWREFLNNCDVSVWGFNYIPKSDIIKIIRQNNLLYLIIKVNMAKDNEFEPPTHQSSPIALLGRGKTVTDLTKYRSSLLDLPSNDR